MGLTKIDVNDTNNLSPVGTIIASSLQVPPTGWLLCDGSNGVSRVTYSTLFNAIVPNKGAVTMTIATPCVVTLNNHNFLTGESIFLTTTGALPTGLAINTLYFVISVDGNTFRLATSYANAIAGTPINTSGSQSGTHTLFYCPYGLGSTTSNFKLPDLRSATIRGRGLSTGFSVNATTRLGFLENDVFGTHNHGGGSHTHGIGQGPSGNFTGLAGGHGGTDWGIGMYTAGSGTIISTQGDTETRMKNQGVNFFIKF